MILCRLFSIEGNRWLLRSIILFIFVLLHISPSLAGLLPVGFVYADDLIPTLIVELRYLTSDNFVGEKIDGYYKSRCILTKQATAALIQVQDELRQKGLGLKIFDAYRPQQAVDHFVRWSRNIKDTKMKQQYYPKIEKKNLFRDGYVYARSSHSRGSTVDLTIVKLSIDGHVEELDMGTTFDFYSPESWTNYSGISSEQLTNRFLLQRIMVKHGFKPYSREWWHFTLKNEPFRDVYFNFPVQ